MRSRILITLCGLLIMTTLNACSGNIDGIKSACGVFPPISYSVRDTEETRKQIVIHNVRWERTCAG